MYTVARAFIILSVCVLVCPALGQADIAYIKNEDKLVGTIQSPAFSLQTPYGKIRVETEYLKSIRFEEGSTRRWVLETINNDQFSGALLNDSVRFLQDDGRNRTLQKGNIKRIWREVNSPSQRTTTTIVTMKNNDRFSGKFLGASLDIRANFITKSIPSEDINRLEFVENYQDNAEILLENGDVITGVLKQHQFRLAPDSVAELTLAGGSVKSLQFNAPKMILKRFNGSGHFEADSDGDGIPDYADLCMDTPAGVSVDMDGCTRRSHQASATAPKKINGHQKDPENLMAAQSDQIPKILFDFDRAELKPRYYAVLDEAAKIISRSPQTQAEIHGHTDNVGTEAYNQYLSEQRAQVVEQYLVQKGIAEEKLVTKGFGYTINAASNASKAGRALNRRVEILLMPDQGRLAYRDQN
jgi:outer membrane protein OmpA-like peptidoglycan-associated protein